MVLYMLPVFAEPVIVIRAKPHAAAHRVMFYTIFERKWVQIVFFKSSSLFLFFSQQLFTYYISFDWQLLSYTPLHTHTK